jgi:hypothetical protein
MKNSVREGTVLEQSWGKRGGEGENVSQRRGKIKAELVQMNSEK